MIIINKIIKIKRKFKYNMMINQVYMSKIDKINNKFKFRQILIKYNQINYQKNHQIDPQIDNQIIDNKIFN